MTDQTAENVAIDVQTMRERARSAVSLLKSISNENRLMILCHLSKGEMSVSELNERIDLSQSALSQHLAILRRDGLVSTRRESLTIYYSLISEEAARLIQFLYSEFCES